MKSIVLSVILISISLWAKPNTTIDVVTYGKGKPVIIIAGFSGADYWHNTAGELAQSYEVHVIAVKGVSGQKTPNRFDLERINGDIHDFLKSKGFDKPMLIGHSFGGFLAMQLAAKYNNLVGKLIIVDSYPFALAMFNPATSQEIGVQQAQVYRSQVSALPQAHYEAFWRQNATDMVSSLEEQVNFCNSVLLSDKDFIIDAQCAMLATDLRPVLASISCPTQVLCSAFNYLKLGLDEQTIKARVDAQFQNLPNCTTFIHQSAKHFLMLDDYAWLIDKINQFI